MIFATSFISQGDHLERRGPLKLLMMGRKEEEEEEGEKNLRRGSVASFSIN